MAIPDWYKDNHLERETPRFVAWYEAENSLPLGAGDEYWFHRAAALAGWRGFAVAAAARAAEAGDPQGYEPRLARLGWDLVKHVVGEGQKLADNFALRSAAGTPLLTVAVAAGVDASLLLSAIAIMVATNPETPALKASRQALLDQWPAVLPKLEAQILRLGTEEETDGGQPA